MLDQAGSAAEGLAREVVNGYLPIVQVRVRNSVQVLGDQVSHDGQVLAHSRRAHLLMVTDHQDRLA